EALQNANIDEAYCKENEIGIVFGNDTSTKAVVDSYLKSVEEGNTMILGSGMAFQSLTSNVASNLANIFCLRGANFTTASACASSAQSIALATMLIQSGVQDIIVAGGAQETNDLSMIAFDGVNTLSKRNLDPEHASRPFDKLRDGLVPSGGAATLVLEEYEHAKQRGANILAEVLGYGFSQNDTPLGQPSQDAEYTAMQRALKSANLLPQDIDYVNAHAISTIVGDIAEAQALTRIFVPSSPSSSSSLSSETSASSLSSPLISSTKSMTGHECWMAGVSETIYSILMMQNSFVAPTINLKEVDDSASQLNIVRETTTAQINIAMSNSFGFGGTNYTIILKKL
ncbi:MAG: beta-ketoacyl-[Paludibacteraceae bacterium]|nr:beta-ketoacyl-[acyl-carrier-protein] synthase family protein [Paludibacteraceae bacterium]